MRGFSFIFTSAVPISTPLNVSGYDGDGAAALCGIKEVGGITIAQKPDTAGQPDMPESAMASGCIDFVLSPEDIAKEIIRIANTIE
jgi:chemotaxis response regulator CheB